MERYRIRPGEALELDKRDPDDRAFFPGSKEEGLQQLAKLNARLEELQEVLYAEAKHRLLVVLQAMDTGGKDSTIRHVFQGMDPLGVRAVSFKAPVGEELTHDYLWRIHRHMPDRGEIVIFNRSHYEDVVMPWVHKQLPPSRLRRRLRQIKEFERMLWEEGSTILKFYLHISREEQRKRLGSRLKEPHKQWKFNPADLVERKLWPHYMEAYTEAISQTSTTWAPWYVVPANSKWYRNLVVSTVLVETLESLRMAYPKPPDLRGVVVE